MVESESRRVSVWLRVGRGGRVVRPYSERPPVRQKIHPNIRFSQAPRIAGKWNVGDRRFQATRGESASYQPCPEEKECITFFIKNFPESCNNATLKEIFGKVGQVQDVFIPNKRDLTGRRFGFIRFISKQDRRALLEEINKVWIGSYKIRAFFPRFDRRDTTVREKENTREKDQAANANHIRIDKSSRRYDGKLYSEAVTGTRKDGEENVRGGRATSEKIDMEFQSSSAERTWLERCYTGHLKLDFSWSEHGEEIQSECGNRLKLRFMGNNLVLIQGAGDEAVNAIIDEFDEWLKFWFVWARPWKYIDVSQQRAVWTRWIGVPLHAWSERFFILGSASMGAFLELHDDTKRKECLDTAFVKVSTGLNAIDRVLHCKIDGASFRIRVEEIKCVHVQKHKDLSGEQRWSSDTESESESDEEGVDGTDIGECRGSPEKQSPDEERTVEGPECNSDPHARRIPENPNDVLETQTMAADNNCTASSSQQNFVKTNANTNENLLELTLEGGGEKEKEQVGLFLGEGPTGSTHESLEIFGQDYENTERVETLSVGLDTQQGPNRLKVVDNGFGPENHPHLIEGREIEEMTSREADGDGCEDQNQQRERSTNQLKRKTATKVNGKQNQSSRWSEFIQNMAEEEERQVEKVETKKKKKNTRKGKHDLPDFIENNSAWKFGRRIGLLPSLEDAKMEEVLRLNTATTVDLGVNETVNQ